MIEPLADDRLMAAIRSLILAECPGLIHSTTWEYAVTSVNDDGTINGQPTAAIPLPALNNVPLGGLALGGSSEPHEGALFLVDFINQGGARYAILSVDGVVKNATTDAVRSVKIGPSAKAVKLGPNPLKQIGTVGNSLAVFCPKAKLNGTIDGDPVTDLTISVVCPAPGIVSFGSSTAVA